LGLRLSLLGPSLLGLRFRLRLLRRNLLRLNLLNRNLLRLLYRLPGLDRLLHTSCKLSRRRRLLDWHRLRNRPDIRLLHLENRLLALRLLGHLDGLLRACRSLFDLSRRVKANCLLRLRILHACRRLFACTRLHPLLARRILTPHAFLVRHVAHLS
jgi:hypothetical protein